MDQPTVKTAASKLRALLMLGKLRPEQVSRLRTAGMLPSRQQYASGFRAGVTARLQKAFNRSRNAFSEGIEIHQVDPDLAEAVHTARPGGPLGGMQLFDGMAKLKLPYGVGVENGHQLNLQRQSLHDLLGTLHEVLEHRSYVRTGGSNRYRTPLSAFGSSFAHNPGVMTGERTAYERLLRQLGVHNPNWAAYRVSADGSTRLPDELVRATFSTKDESALTRLFQRLEHARVLPKSKDSPTWGAALLNPNRGITYKTQGAVSMSRNVLAAAKRVADKTGNTKLINYLNAYEKTLDHALNGGIPVQNLAAINTPGLRQHTPPDSVWDTYIRAGRR